MGQPDEKSVLSISSLHTPCLFEIKHLVSPGHTLTKAPNSA